MFRFSPKSEEEYLNFPCDFTDDQPHKNNISTIKSTRQLSLLSEYSFLVSHTVMDKEKENKLTFPCRIDDFRDSSQVYLFLQHYVLRQNIFLSFHFYFSFRFSPFFFL